MAKKKQTVFQALDKAISGNWNSQDMVSPHVNTYDMSGMGDKNNIIYKTNDKEDYLNKKLELQQDKYLKDRWVKANVNLSVTAYAGLNNVKLMYRDADLMDAFPEIGAALDIVSEESTITNDKGMIVNVYSKSDRIKSILEDLFVNRLNIQLTGQMIIRAMCKYGNQYMLLDIDNKNGVKGWKQLPVFNMERIENGIQNPYGAGASIAVNGINTDDRDLSTQFVWLDDNNSQVPFRDWQIAHFRLLTNSLYLPYGCLVGDTRVEMENGYKEISKIGIGDRVWTFNINTQERELAEVTMAMNKGEKNVYKVSTYHNEIEGTDDHKLLTYDGDNLVYKQIGDIKVGDLLVIDNSKSSASKAYETDEVRKIEYVGKKETYDITVSNDNSNFFANGIVTHNCSYLNSARRHWRMLSLMEDMMLIYRLERSIERRVYKIFVGAIDDADVQGYVERIANEFKRTPIVDPVTGQIDLRKNILPVHKDTPIPLLDGRTITIENLAKEFEDGKENYVYSVQDKTHKIVGGKVVWCGKNYTADKLIKITLDDDSYMIMAEEHEVIMRDGSKKRADGLNVGDSVMPFYRMVNKKSNKLFDRYEKIYNPQSSKYEFTHKIIASELSKDVNTYNTVHHKNFDKYNNNPTNLIWMDYHEHHKMHGDLARKNWNDPIKRKTHEDFKAYNQSDLHKQHDQIRKKATKESWVGNGRINRIKKMTIRFDDFIWSSILDQILQHHITKRKDMLDYINSNLIDYLISINNNRRLKHNHFISRTVLEKRIKDKGFETITEYINASLKNHKITKIEYIDGDDVYCMTVVGPNGEEDRHNFAIRTCKEDKTWNESGCFVSNCVDQDIFIPVRDENAPTPIDTLSAAQNMTALDDIKFVQNKVLTALRIPKSFLNFEENAGDGKNLALMDIRFTRTVNRIQQAFLMELTKVASIHLFLLGFNDELNNFTLSMNNPSTQAEQLEIDNMQKKIDAVRDAVSDPGNGLPVMSQTRALKQIMKWSEKEIKENLEEIRLEKGIAAELEKTTQIIKKTGIFDTVDRIYGEPGAEYMDDQQGGQGGIGDDGMGGGGAPPLAPMDSGGDMGGDLGALGGPSDDGSGGDIAGAEGSMPTSDMEGSQEPPMESVNKNKPLITENIMFNKYMKMLNEHSVRPQETSYKRASVYDRERLLINEEFDKMIKELDKYVDDIDKE